MTILLGHGALLLAAQLIWHGLYGIVYCMAYSIAWGMAYCMAYGMAYSIAYGIAYGIAWGMAYGMTWNSLLTPYGMDYGIAYGIASQDALEFDHLVKTIILSLTFWSSDDLDLIIKSNTAFGSEYFLV